VAHAVPKGGAHEQPNRFFPRGSLKQSIGTPDRFHYSPTPPKKQQLIARVHIPAADNEPPLPAFCPVVDDLHPVRATHANRPTRAMNFANRMLFIASPVASPIGNTCWSFAHSRA